jgi:hypothetical protein
MADAGRPLEAGEVERALKTIRGVRGARVEIDASGITAVKVLVVPEVGAHDVVGRVVRTAADQLGVEIPPERIEVMHAGEPDAAGQRGRRKLSSLSTRRSGTDFMVRVTLELAGDVLVGEAEAPSGQLHEQRAVARGVLEGIGSLIDQPTELESVSLLTIGDRRLAVVSVLLGQELLVGSALVRLDDHDAVARATLDALNRALTVLL